MRDWLHRIAACSVITFASSLAAQAEPLNVVATFSIIGDFATQVGGDRIELKVLVAALPEERRTVVVAHNAFRYFEAAYGVHFLSPQGVSTESDAAAADVAGLIREIRDHNATAIFAENISDTRLLERIAAEAGLTLAGTLYSDALSGPDGPAPSYVAMMRHNANSIAAALSAP